MPKTTTTRDTNSRKLNGEEYYECKLCCEAKKSSLLALKRCAQSNTHTQQLLEEETELLKEHWGGQGTTLPNEESTPQATTKPIPKPRKSKMKQQNLEDPTLPKLSELRAREINVKKVEEQLKIKKISLNEIRNEKLLLESRCQQLEARNFELEQTVKLLNKGLNLTAT
ncbi:unnamed protein product [Mytilus coruscus]|uniref:Uncharacterized protein n=1 Tax=Mytilus coruscus TaxID=42192 RepID=A0A6J8CN40_MYTCO|nr:unnamed protein product [Mytilus coruscus]